MLALAAPATVPAPQTRCTVTDERLAELSGLVALGHGPAGGEIWAMADGGRETTVHRLDESCAVAETRSADVDPYDAEDLAVGPDGELWVADIGDNRRTRETVAVIVLPRSGDARLHRLAYPDGPHDAEALLVDAAGVPYVVTKDSTGAGVYRTAGLPDGAGPTPLERVGTVALPPSETTGGPLGTLGTRLVTGAAATADGSLVALRTYTDAWLFPVAGGGIGDALVGLGPAGGNPVRVPLPDEPQGEAIALTADGTLLSASETRQGPGELRAVPGAAALGASAGPAVPAGAGAEPVTTADTTPDWLPALIGGGVVVALLVLLSAAVSLRARGRR